MDFIFDRLTMKKKKIWRIWKENIQLRKIMVFGGFWDWEKKIDYKTSFLGKTVLHRFSFIPVYKVYLDLNRE